jgi:hypothetical protein
MKRQVRRNVLASCAAVASAILVALIGWAALVLIPGTPDNALLHGSIDAAGRGEREFLRSLSAPETELQYRASVLWYDVGVLPLVVITGSLVGAALSGGSWVCAAVGGILPAPALVLVGPLGDRTSAAEWVRAVLIVGRAWVASLGLRRLWEARRSR